MRSADELAVLARSIDVVRSELLDRDDDAIPNRLRKAARATGKTLPVPHQRSVLDYLESDEHFREAVRERWVASGDSDALTDAYLTDPESAEPLIRAAAALAAIRRVEQERDTARSEVTVLAGKLTEAKARLINAKKEAKEELRQAVEADRRSREGLERSAASAKAELDDAQATIESLTAAIEEQEASLEDAKATLKRVSEREARRSVAASSARTRTTEPLPSDAVALAKWLDRLERRLKYYRDPARRQSDGEAQSDGETFGLPLGISPESREAVDAVVVADADRIIIDGYNVAGAVLFEAFSSRAGREAAIARADMLKRATSASVTVVFDAANVKGDSRFTTDDGTRVLFEPEQSADDAIVFLVQETDDRCIVITNDRELQTRVGRPNCVAVFTTALIEWSEHLNER
jgi:hypothetical protein